MSDYISRESAIKALRDLRKQFSIEEDENKAFNLGLFQGIIFASKEIKAIPAADVRPVEKAAWYGEADGYADGELVYDMWSCPVCGKRFEEWEEKPDWNFCPNCGADMREES